MSAVIKVEDVSKQYRLGTIGTGSFQHDINRWWHRLRGKEDPYLKIGEENDRATKGNSDYVWSLKNINFEVQQGDVLGIIGRNGAGKSTLLKILSRTTGPTTGKIKIKGRVASLLEVGTGFHPELSGRENIFLNGAILGMRKKEIENKFDEIVDFAGVERYIDTPVKRYSSGMYVRLAFAVAAHLESEILIVDEVLAVGDAEFQKKCIGKMGEVSKGGRTVLFVSHQMGTIAQLCNKAILMQQGKVVKQDYTSKVIDFYLRKARENHEGYVAKEAKEDMAIIRAFTQNESGEKTSTFTHLQRIDVIMTIKINKFIKDADLRFIVRDVNGKCIFTSDIAFDPRMLEVSDTIEAVATIPEHFLRPGNFVVTLATLVHNVYHIQFLEDVLVIDVVDGGSRYAATEGLDYGYVFFDPIWNIKPIKQ